MTQVREKAHEIILEHLQRCYEERVANRDPLIIMRLMGLETRIKRLEAVDPDSPAIVAAERELLKLVKERYNG